MRDLSLALVQMDVGPDRDDDLERAEALVEQAAGDGAELVVLPEMFACPYELERFRERAEPLEGGPTPTRLARLARRLRLHLVGGSFPELHEGGVYNTATLWSPEGELLRVHRKVHLFDVDIPGGIRFQESERLRPGDRIEAVDTALGRLGMGICYDLRFPELLRSLAVQGAELLVLPGAFNTTTGPAHWEPLLRARAIENTCYVAACSPAPHPGVSYPAWGHSMVVDPWGEVIARAGRGPEVVTARLEAARLQQVRAALPVLAQRRPSVYSRAVVGEPGEPTRTTGGEES